MSELRFPDMITIGDKYGPAMAITDPVEAARYFEACVEHTMRWQEKNGETPDRAHAEQIERANLGYYAGYGDSKQRARVERMFGCAHPIFGAIVEKGEPTPEEAFEAGRKAAG